MRLSCFLCGKQYDPNVLQNTCECGRPLRVDHDLTPKALPKEALKTGSRRFGVIEKSYLPAPCSPWAKA